MISTAEIFPLFERFLQIKIQTMKQLLVLLVLSFLCIAGVAQNINLAFNSVGSGRNITAYYEVEKGDNSYNFGLGYNMNKHALNDDQNQFFRKRLYE